MVLTSRIAKLLRESEGSSFRVLALTFTNKAADEMQSRAQLLCPEVEERAAIGTFHSFCMQMLQQHGSHIGIKPDFAIYSLDEDRRELLRDGLRREFGSGQDATSLDRYLRLIDKLKGMLIDENEAASKFRDPAEGENVARAYRAYEHELRSANALDFNSLILRAHQLVKQFDGIAQRYRKTYRYWMLDEFQDTNRAQYKFLRTLAGESFKNIFAVADDDQIIYQWNGASFAQLQKFRTDFSPELVQLPTNFRCPPPIVNAANNLVRHNTSRTPDKLPLEAGKVSAIVPADQAILLGSYPTDADEAEAVANAIASQHKSTWGRTVILARTKAILEKMKASMVSKGISVTLAQRRDDFVSSQFRWLHAVLRQVSRPQDARNFSVLVESFNRWADSTLSSDLIAAQSEGSGRSLLDEWLLAIRGCGGERERAVELASTFSRSEIGYTGFVAEVRSLLEREPHEPGGDLEEDEKAWASLQKTIGQIYGRSLALDQFLQYMALQSKEPPVPEDTVALMTIHAAKGKEFDFVYLVGVAEEVLPSFQSLKAGEGSAEMEEERRNCFVAITRTREQLVLTWASRYRGYSKKPSRFLAEMGFTT